MNPNLVALLYLAAGVLFIMALRGLSSPESSRRGNQYGMIGMAIAVPPRWRRSSDELAAHLGADHRRPRHRRRHRRRHRAAHPDDVDAGAGGGVPLARRPRGRVRGRRRALCAGSVRHRPRPATSPAASLLEMSLGVAIGAITFTGSVIAFAKLSGRMSGKPITLPGRHVINIGLAAAHRAARRLVLPVGRRSHAVLGHHGGGAAVRRAHHHPDRRRRHAGRDLDAQLLLGLGGGRHRLHARQHRADRHRRAGRLVGRDPVLHHVQGHEPLVRVGDPGRLRRRDGRPRGRRRAAPGQARLGRGRRLPDEERRQGHHRAGLRHGGRAGPACAARDGRQPQEGRRRGEVRHPSRRGPHAGPHERAAGRSQRALRRGVRAGGHQQRVRPGRHRLRHRRQRRDQPGGRGRQDLAHLRHARAAGVEGRHRDVQQALAGQRAMPASTTRCSTATTP